MGQALRRRDPVHPQGISRPAPWSYAPRARPQLMHRSPDSSTLAASSPWQTRARTQTSPSSSSLTRSSRTSMASTPSSARWASELLRHLVEPRTCSAQRTVHPQVIDGVDSTLEAMERVPVNAKNRPLNEIRTTHVRNRPSTPRSSRLPRARPRCRYDRPRPIRSRCADDRLFSQVTIHANPIADAQLVGR